MSEPLPSLTVDEFSDFFRAVHGNEFEPFPWQQRLLHRVLDSGWPAVLDLPTGTGKTAVLDIAVFALALAGPTDRRMPRRVVYVVDRRTVVDQAYRRAERIQTALASPPIDIVQRVDARLRSLSSESDHLGVALLRGGIARDDAWASAPDQALIVVSTVDQVGSRLLFRGYGISDSMKPVHAGLLGNDVLYLLDEVHLSNPFRETLATIKERYRGWADMRLPSPFEVVEMSATPGRRQADTFTLKEPDHEHPVLLRRLNSSKPAVLVPATARSLAGEVETHVTSMLKRPGATIAVVVNRVNTARELHARLATVVPGGTDNVRLLTGRMRPFDRDRLEGGLVERIRAGRTRTADAPPIVVVATQSIEAGADFDFDGLITECASLDALRQRFGRLDRLGELSGTARGVVLGRSDSFKNDPVYGDAIGETWKWLQTIAVDGLVDFGISRLVIPEPVEPLLAPKPSAPVLLPSHLDAWSQTEPIPTPDPDVSLWLHGPERGVADVQVVWRADVTEDLLREALLPDRVGKRATEVAVGMVEALPPVGREAMSVPFVAVQRWLAGRPEPDSFDVEGSQEPEAEERTSPVAASPKPAIAWRGDRSSVVAPKDLTPGQTIVVPSAYGGIAHDNWAPASTAPVSDVAEFAAAAQRQRVVIRLHPAVLPAELGPPPAAVQDGLDEDTRSDRKRVEDWLDALTVPIELPGWDTLVADLRKDGSRLRVERLSCGTGVATGEYLVVAGIRTRASGRASDDRSTDDADSARGSFTGVPVPLVDHLDGVSRRAAALAERVGLPVGLIGALEFAGKWHDAGKADPRFQRWLHGGSEFKALVQREPLAKSAVRINSRKANREARERAGYPEHARHELMTVALLDTAGDALGERCGDRSLVLHLIASHHGFCRPLAPWVEDSSPVDVTFGRDGLECRATSDHTLASFDSGVADRFWELQRRYGWWGLALLEALLRLADHRQSESEQDSRERRRA